MPELEINFGWTSNAQSLTANIRQIKSTGEGFARMIVNDFALASTEEAYLANRSSLVGSVRKVALAEVSRMALLMSNSIAMPDKYTGPYGEMSIKEGMSDTYQRMGFSPTFKRQRTSIVWPKRRKRYLEWKKRHGHPAKWWELSGELSKSLNDADQFLHAWGPVNVLFTRARSQDKARGGMQKSWMMSGGGALDGQSSSANLQQSITHGGRAGRISAEYQVGKLEVIAFGRITPSMLPSLKHPKMDPAYAEPSGNIDGLAGLLKDDGPGGTRNKLLGKQAQRRYALEPFVSFFLTRAIPNAIWRRTERLIASSGIRQSGKLN